jgi:hypothetical protein
MNKQKNENAQIFINSKPSDKILFAMDLDVRMAVEELAKDLNLPQEKVLLDFLKSNTAKMIYNDSTKLWWGGPSVAAEAYKQEKKLSLIERN